jgi:hypothetical protein
MMNTAQTNQTSTAYSDGVDFFDGGKNQSMIVQESDSVINRKSASPIQAVLLCGHEPWSRPEP